MEAAVLRESLLSECDNGMLFGGKGAAGIEPFAKFLGEGDVIANNSSYKPEAYRRWYLNSINLECCAMAGQQEGAIEEVLLTVFGPSTM